jgi:hypothetical protein
VVARIRGCRFGRAKCDREDPRVPVSGAWSVIARISGCRGVNLECDREDQRTPWSEPGGYSSTQTFGIESGTKGGSAHSQVWGQSLSASHLISHVDVSPPGPGAVTHSWPSAHPAAGQGAPMPSVEMSGRSSSQAGIERTRVIARAIIEIRVIMFSVPPESSTESILYAVLGRPRAGGLVGARGRRGCAGPMHPRRRYRSAPPDCTGGA